MMRLLAVELQRLRSRRLCALLLLLGFVITLVAVGATVHDRRPVSGAERAEAERIFERESARPGALRAFEECLDNPRRFGGPDFDCEQVRPQLDDFLSRPQLEFTEAAPDLLIPIVVLFAVLALFVGATAIGAEWASGALGTHLLFEPRRAPVYLTRVAAVLLWTLLAAAVACLAALATVAVFSAAWGTLDIPAAVAERLGWQLVRGLLGVAMAGAVGFAIAMGARHTAAALGVVVAYFLGGELILRSIWPPGERVLLSNHVAAWLQGEHRTYVYDESLCVRRGAGESCSAIPFDFTQATAGWYLAGITLAALLGAWLLFRRRDVA